MTKEILKDEAVYGIVGNKTDLYFNEQVKESDATKYAEEMGMRYKGVTAKQDPKGFISFIEELFDIYYNSDKCKIKNKNITINQKSFKKNENKPKEKKCC